MSTYQNQPNMDQSQTPSDKDLDPIEFVNPGIQYYRKLNHSELGLDDSKILVKYKEPTIIDRPVRIDTPVENQIQNSILDKPQQRILHFYIKNKSPRHSASKKKHHKRHASTEVRRNS